MSCCMHPAMNYNTPEATCTADTIKAMFVTQIQRRFGWPLKSQTKESARAILEHMAAAVRLFGNNDTDDRRSEFDMSVLVGTPFREISYATFNNYIHYIRGLRVLLCRARADGCIYWAAWADALPVMRCHRATQPDVAARCARELAAAHDGSCGSGALRARDSAGAALDAEGWTAHPDGPIPFWGARSPRACARRTGRDRGLALWLAETGSSRTPHVLSRAPAPQLPLRSQSGAHAGEWLRAVPADSRSSPLTRPMLRPTLLRSRRPQHQLDSAGPSAAPSNAAWSRQGPPSTLASGRAHS